jgi:hypothetical protein
MPEEPTLGEVVRRLENIHSDLKEDLRDLANRLDRKVSQDVYEIKHGQLETRIAKVEAEREKEKAERKTDLRAVFTSLIAPIVVIGVISLASIGLALYVAFIKGS